MILSSFPCSGNCIEEVLKITCNHLTGRCQCILSIRFCNPSSFNKVSENAPEGDTLYVRLFLKLNSAYRVGADCRKNVDPVFDRARNATSSRAPFIRMPYSKQCYIFRDRRYDREIR